MPSVKTKSFWGWKSGSREHDYLTLTRHVCFQTAGLDSVFFCSSSEPELRAAGFNPRHTRVQHTAEWSSCFHNRQILILFICVHCTVFSRLCDYAIIAKLRVQLWVKQLDSVSLSDTFILASVVRSRAVWKLRVFYSLWTVWRIDPPKLFFSLHWKWNDA